MYASIGFVVKQRCQRCRNSFHSGRTVEREHLDISSKSFWRTSPHTWVNPLLKRHRSILENNIPCVPAGQTVLDSSIFKWESGSLLQLACAKLACHILVLNPCL